MNLPPVTASLSSETLARYVELANDQVDGIDVSKITDLATAAAAKEALLAIMEPANNHHVSQELAGRVANITDLVACPQDYVESPTHAERLKDIILNRVAAKVKEVEEKVLALSGQGSSGANGTNDGWEWIEQSPVLQSAPVPNPFDVLFEKYNLMESYHGSDRSEASSEDAPHNSVNVQIEEQQQDPELEEQSVQDDSGAGSLHVASQDQPSPHGSASIVVPHPDLNLTESSSEGTLSSSSIHSSISGITGTSVQSPHSSHATISGVHVTNLVQQPVVPPVQQPVRPVQQPVQQQPIRPVQQPAQQQPMRPALPPVQPPVQQPVQQQPIGGPGLQPNTHTGNRAGGARFGLRPTGGRLSALTQMQRVVERERALRGGKK